MELADKIEGLAAKATPGPWAVIYYDCGDKPHYDANGPCPSIQADDADCAIVHWAGFKQEYWTSANGHQKQIEANASLIVELVNNLPAILDALRSEPTADVAGLVERVARALAKADGLDWDEVCGVDADPDEGYCDSGTCVAAHWEEHDAEQARRWYMHLATAALSAMPQAREIERLREAIKGKWFYSEGYDQDLCRDSAEEIIEEMAFRPGERDVVRIDVASPMPSQWYLVERLTEEQKDAADSDDDFRITQHPSEAEARKALEGQP